MYWSSETISIANARSASVAALRVEPISGRRAAITAPPLLHDSSQRERGLGFDARQFLGVADVIEAGDPGVLDPDCHDAIDLAVQPYDECRIAVDHDTVNGQCAFGLGGGADEEANHLLGPGDRPQRSLFEAASVGNKDHLRGEHLKKTL